MEFLPAKKFGFGLMRMPRLDPDNAAAVDVEQVKKMVDLFMSKGFTYFDTAWMYNGFASENVAKEALVDRYPRESFMLATKLPTMFLEKEEDMEVIGIAKNQIKLNVFLIYFFTCSLSPLE